MADINPSADDVRAMLTETLGRLRKASEEYFGIARISNSILSLEKRVIMILAGTSFC